VAVGNFDGVHRGHRAILAAARSAAGDGGTVVAVTFWPHPLAVLRPDDAPKLLSELSERIRLLEEAGADQVRVVRFTPQLAAWSPERFVECVLGPLRPAHVVVGQNFRFGKDAAADGHALARLGRGQFHVVVLPMLTDEGPLSSSRVRAALEAGEVAEAARLLGRPFRHTGIVVQGDQRGRTLGFPTANLTVADDFACPKDGVYAGWLIAPGASGPKATQPGPSGSEAPSGIERVAEGEVRWPAAISVGTNPTFDGVERRVEAHALDQTDLALYGRRVGVDFTDRIRGMVRFAGLPELVAQLESDVAQTRRLLAARES
jgi:riboflavin kinase/FMN adenylyltransferase